MSLPPPAVKGPPPRPNVVGPPPRAMSTRTNSSPNHQRVVRASPPVPVRPSPMRPAASPPSAPVSRASTHPENTSPIPTHPQNVAQNPQNVAQAPAVVLRRPPPHRPPTNQNFRHSLATPNANLASPPPQRIKPPSRTNTGLPRGQLPINKPINKLASKKITIIQNSINLIIIKQKVYQILT